MRVVALLCWYDEPVSWLAETVASAARLADHIVAVDGAYALFPGSTRRPTSDPTQADTITRTARGVGIGVTVHTPTDVWWGGEVEKRDTMLQIAQTVADPGDWYLVIDGDEVVANCPADTRHLLDVAEADVAELIIRSRREHTEWHSPLRRLYRAQPGLRVEYAHYIVTAPDGRTVSNEPAVPLHNLVIDHRDLERSAQRRQQKKQYYAARDELGVEHSPEAVGAR